jgi:hypothetical protein
MIIKCEERYKEATEFAEKTGNKTLQDCLNRIEQWEKNRQSEYFLYKDFAPYSFYFEEYKDGERLLNGGIIYHGNPDQSYSVTMDSTIGWQIHT